MPIATGNVFSYLSTLPDNHYDALLCDPPYGINFMGSKWDYDVPTFAVWEEAYRVLKPGAPILVFGGTRTFHRLVCAIEDGGFEIRDTLAWMHGQGFPKSLNIGKALDGWDGYGTALKPAFEPICLARKQLQGTVANNAIVHGVGGINIDGCRVGIEQVTINTFDNGAKPFGDAVGEAYTSRTSTGRWPANVILDEEAGILLDEQTGNRPSATNKKLAKGGKRERGQVLGQSPGSEQNVALYAGETGGASRFFYCAKVNTKERNAGTDGCTHPTLKPISLTTYLATLILPPKRDSNRRLLVPYSGAGSEMIGAYKAGWEEVQGIELDPQYVEIASKRLFHWRTVGMLLGEDGETVLEDCVLD